MDANKEGLYHGFLTLGNRSRNGDHGGRTPIAILWLSIRVNSVAPSIGGFLLFLLHGPGLEVARANRSSIQGPADGSTSAIYRMLD